MRVCGNHVIIRAERNLDNFGTLSAWYTILVPCPVCWIAPDLIIATLRVRMLESLWVDAKPQGEGNPTAEWLEKFVNASGFCDCFQEAINAEAEVVKHGDDIVPKALVLAPLAVSCWSLLTAASNPFLHFALRLSDYFHVTTTSRFLLPCARFGPSRHSQCPGASQSLATLNQIFAEACAAVEGVLRPLIVAAHPLATEIRRVITAMVEDPDVVSDPAQFAWDKAFESLKTAGAADFYTQWQEISHVRATPQRLMKLGGTRAETLFKDYDDANCDAKIADLEHATMLCCAMECGNRTTLPDDCSSRAQLMRETRLCLEEDGIAMPLTLSKIYRHRMAVPLPTPAGDASKSKATGKGDKGGKAGGEGKSKGKGEDKAV